MTVWGYFLCAIVLTACLVLIIIRSFEIGLIKGFEFATDIFESTCEEDDINEPR